jgi:hypothetical protein
MENSEMKTTKRYLAIIIAVIIIVIIWLFRSCGSGTTPENATQTQDVVIEDASVEVEVPDESIAEEPGEAESVIEETAEAAAEETSADVFSDVNDPKHPYYDAIVWASENNITKGYVDGSFGIDDTCTRGQAVMFLWRMDGCPEPEQAEVSPFTDVPDSHAFYKAVLWAQQKGITKGYTTGEKAGQFAVDDPCTRGQIMTFIWRYKGQPSPEEVSESPFSDVEPSHAYYKAILWGSQEGVTKGYTTGPDAGKFGIDDACTRGQIVTFLYRIR